MAFRDWNGDGEKNYIDTAIELMILDDIEAEEEKGAAEGPAYTFREKPEASKGGIEIPGDEFLKLLAIIPGIAAAFILIGNIGAIFTGYVSIPGIVVSTAVLLLLWKCFKKKK